MHALDAILDVVRYVILADVILSWVMPDPEQFPRNVTRQLTAPLYAPVHAVIPPGKMGGIDLSPLIVLILLSVLQSALH